MENPTSPTSPTPPPPAPVPSTPPPPAPSPVPPAPVPVTAAEAAGTPNPAPVGVPPVTPAAPTAPLGASPSMPEPKRKVNPAIRTGSGKIGGLTQATQPHETAGESAPDVTLNKDGLEPGKEVDPEQVLRMEAQWSRERREREAAEAKKNAGK